MKLVVFGLTVTSSWGNGHATTYRGLLRELVRAVPVDELQRPAGEGEMGVVEDREERAQALPGKPRRRRRRVLGKLGGPAVDSAETP